MGQKSMSIRLSERSYNELEAQAKRHKKTLYAFCQGIIGKWLSDHRKSDSVDAQTQEIVDGIKYISESRAKGRQMSEALLVYKDDYGRLDSYATMVEYHGMSQRVTDDMIYILDKLLIRLLPKSVKQKIRQYAMTKEDQKQSLSSAMIEMIGETEVDSIGYEVDQEFENLLQDASAVEAFNRGLR